MLELVELVSYNREPLPTEMERRFRRVDVDFRLLRERGCSTLADVAALVANGWVEDGRSVFPVDMPADARIVRAGYSMIMDRVAFLVTSREFEPVPEGEMVPLWHPVYHAQEAMLAR